MGSTLEPRTRLPGVVASQRHEHLIGATCVLGDLGLRARTRACCPRWPLTVVARPPDSILPVQGTYYATMLASMPAKMLISMSNSMGASQAMQAGQQAMLADVTKMLDAKMKALLASISGQMRGFGSTITAQLASAGQVGWAVGSERLGAGGARDGPRRADTAGQQHRGAERAAATPNSPFTQALMGALNGRGMGTQAAKTASVKVETRTPAGG